MTYIRMRHRYVSASSKLILRYYLVDSLCSFGLERWMTESGRAHIRDIQLDRGILRTRVRYRVARIQSENFHLW